eukprot:scaffold230238_cov23-Tisochrysis_lutea.AAC.1
MCMTVISQDTWETIPIWGPAGVLMLGIWLGVRDEKRRRLTFTAYQTCMGLWLLEELSCKELNRLCMPGLAACNKDRFPD